MNTNHTPKPWHITKDVTAGQFVTETRIRDKHNSVICNLHVNAEGNGPLLAAAPDLLEALENVIAYAMDVLDNPEQLACFKPGVVEAHVKMAQAAIAKANGLTE